MISNNRHDAYFKFKHQGYLLSIGDPEALRALENATSYATEDYYDEASSKGDFHPQNFNYLTIGNQHRVNQGSREVGRNYSQYSKASNAPSPKS